MFVLRVHMNTFKLELRLFLTFQRSFLRTNLTLQAFFQSRMSQSLGFLVKIVCFGLFPFRK